MKKGGVKESEARKSMRKGKERAGRQERRKGQAERGREAKIVRGKEQHEKRKERAGRQGRRKGQTGKERRFKENSVCIHIYISSILGIRMRMYNTPF